jgi:hypothetical protein
MMPRPPQIPGYHPPQTQHQLPTNLGGHVAPAAVPVPHLQPTQSISPRQAIQLQLARQRLLSQALRSAPPQAPNLSLPRPNYPTIK